MEMTVKELHEKVQSGEIVSDIELQTVYSEDN